MLGALLLHQQLLCSSLHMSCFMTKAEPSLRVLKQVSMLSRIEALLLHWQLLSSTCGAPAEAQPIFA